MAGGDAVWGCFSCFLSGLGYIVLMGEGRLAREVRKRNDKEEDRAWLEEELLKDLKLDCLEKLSNEGRRRGAS